MKVVFFSGTCCVLFLIVILNLGLLPEIAAVHLLDLKHLSDRKERLFFCFCFWSLSEYRMVE